MKNITQDNRTEGRRFNQTVGAPSTGTRLFSVYKERHITCAVINFSKNVSLNIVPIYTVVVILGTALVCSCTARLLHEIYFFKNIHKITARCGARTHDPLWEPDLKSGALTTRPT